ncbi:uncharacterized protein LOC121967488 [Zingiber officinale]|uniref:uncharacterized protein LOC121967488 n=1 Tax=Zingiber officinale TaxID=94328 RepID=UPI001C4C4758|nr:uncharacterized protein LOC121967488 [Zingiber officinale]
MREGTPATHTTSSPFAATCGSLPDYFPPFPFPTFPIFAYRRFFLHVQLRAERVVAGESFRNFELQMIPKFNALAFSADDAASAAVGSSRARWCRIGASVCLVFVLSFVFLVHSSFDYRLYWSFRCHGCIGSGEVQLAPATAAAVAPSPASVDPSPTNLSHIVFCIGGSAATWTRRRGYSALWWRPERTRGHVWLDEAPPAGAWSASDPPFRVSANASRFGNRAAPSRMARIVAESQRLHAQDASVRWFVMGDDDTVFFVDNLVATLRKYDHDEMYYVGTPSESVEQNDMHSYGMAFGGGGFAVSAPAAAEFARVVDGCLDRYANLYGSDQRVHSCFTELGIPLTREPGFHQLDLRGDAYGLLAAHPVTPLVTLHHLDYLAPIRPGEGGGRLGALRSLMEASLFDPGRILQQCFCYEAQRGFAWSVSVSWGYTAQLYPRALPATELEIPLRTFKTWRSSSQGPFTFNTRPLADDRPCERPFLFFLGGIREGKRRPDGTGTTVSEYSRYPKGEAGRCKELPGFDAASRVETVKVMAPKMDMASWRRAPRRQCCQTRWSRWGRRTLEVRIRNCRPGDLTPPM